MIFLTVGTQLPFDRLTRTVDEWCESRDTHVFGQIASPGPNGYHPRHFEWEEFLKPAEFDARVSACELVIAHAGMGSIITALAKEKPILVMPRRAQLQEQRNDHQIATARRLGELGKIAVAMDEAELVERLDRLDELKAAGAIGPYAQDSLIEAVRGVIFPGGAR